MAAYAAVVSLTHILDLIKNHPSPPISLDKQQLHSLTEILTYLQEFLEGYVSPFTYSDEADPFEIRIADAAYAAEDVIESYIVDNIHLTTHDDDDDDDEDDYDDDVDDLIKTLIEAMDLIKKDVDVIESDIVDNIHVAAASTTDDDDYDYDYDDDDDAAMESHVVDNIQVAAASTTQDEDDDDDNDAAMESHVVDNIQVAAASTTQDEDDDDDNDAAMESHVVDNIQVAAASTTQDEDDDDDNDAEMESHVVDNIQVAATSTTTQDEDDDDVMESYTVDSIQLAAAATHHEDEQIRYNFYEDLQKVIEAMGLIKKEAMEMELVREKGGLLEAELQRNVSVDAGFKSSSTESKIEMVGSDDVRLELLERLTGGDSNLKVIPIVGMSGIGKTTLARNAFAHQLIKERFDICLWATISRDYNIEQTLREVMSQGRHDSSGDKSVAELGVELHKYLFGRRYLVVMDDMWNIEVWDEMRNFFPDCGKGSRIIVTTRISNLASHLTNSSTDSLCMSFLNKVDSWTLFSKTVFGSQGSDADLQLQLREIGEKIVGKCKGLPLSIAVIGGLLAKSERTQGYWEYIEKNLNSIVNLENEEYCLRVLKLSYNNLPAYLKPCFLYMGVFDEDKAINISTIIKLWVSEGFLKPKEKKNLETVAREYFQELVERNLILTGGDEESWRLYLWDYELGAVGMTKLCRVHDLVRDLSLREAQKHRFYYVYSKRNPPQDPISHRRIVVPDGTSDFDYYPALESSSHPRSYVCHDGYVLTFPNFRLLRTLHTTTNSPPFLKQKDVFGLVNSRLLAIEVARERQNNVLRSSISRLWSLHTLLVYSWSVIEGPVKFWNMHQLKHVECPRGEGRLRLPLPPNNDNNIVILENLHTLIGVKDLHLNEDVVRRMPNLTILDVSYGDGLNWELHSLIYLQHLSKLESFRCSIEKESGKNLPSICFPPSLKQIHLIDIDEHLIQSEDVLQMIGELPFVEDLVIGGGFFRRGEWETIQGHFPRLKSLKLSFCDGLKKWIVSEASHFPLLHELILDCLFELEEIPSEIGDIATLKSIDLRNCSESVVLSAKKIVEEQEDSYGEKQTILSYFPTSLASIFQVQLPEG